MLSWDPTRGQFVPMTRKRYVQIKSKMMKPLQIETL